MDVSGAYIYMHFIWIPFFNYYLSFLLLIRIHERQSFPIPCMYMYCISLYQKNIESVDIFGEPVFAKITLLSILTGFHDRLYQSYYIQSTYKTILTSAGLLCFPACTCVAPIDIFGESMFAKLLALTHASALIRRVGGSHITLAELSTK